MTIQKVSNVVGGISMLEQGLAQTFFSNMPDFRESYQKLQNDVVKAKDMYRNGQWAGASKYYETAGKYYSAMYCLHKAIETKDGAASEHYKKLAAFYHKVGKDERAKRYSQYSWYQLKKENKAYATDYFKNNKLNIDMPKLERDIGDVMYDDHETFRQNLASYVGEASAETKVANSKL